MTHRPHYPYTVVGLFVYLRDKYASGIADIGGKKKKKTEESGYSQIAWINDTAIFEI